MKANIPGIKRNLPGKFSHNGGQAVKKSVPLLASTGTDNSPEFMERFGSDNFHESNSASDANPNRESAERAYMAKLQEERRNSSLANLMAHKTHSDAQEDEQEEDEDEGDDEENNEEGDGEDAQQDGGGAGKGSGGSAASSAAMGALAKRFPAIKVASSVLGPLKQINIGSDFPYIMALLAAIIKDAADYFKLAAPGVAHAIIAIITVGCSLFIALVMMYVGAGEKKKLAQGVVKRYGVLVLGTMSELVIGIDFLPMETITVIIIYIMVLFERAKAQGQPG